MPLKIVMIFSGNVVPDQGADKGNAHMNASSKARRKEDMRAVTMMMRTPQMNHANARAAMEMLSFR
jgi:hypothetical protein